MSFDKLCFKIINEYEYYSEIANNNKITNEIKAFTYASINDYQTLGLWNNYASYMDDNLFEPWLITENINYSMVKQSKLEQ